MDRRDGRHGAVVCRHRRSRQLGIVVAVVGTRRSTGRSMVRRRGGVEVFRAAFRRLNFVPNSVQSSAYTECQRTLDGGTASAWDPNKVTPAAVTNVARDKPAAADTITCSAMPIW